jgi:hypothetical protein
VPEAAVRRQLADLTGSMRAGAMEAEGFAGVHVIRSAADLDALSIEPSGG